VLVGAGHGQVGDHVVRPAPERPARGERIERQPRERAEVVGAQEEALG
jgi:hypothetical protein